MPYVKRIIDSIDCDEAASRCLIELGHTAAGRAFQKQGGACGQGVEVGGVYRVPEM